MKNFILICLCSLFGVTKSSAFTNAKKTGVPLAAVRRNDETKIRNFDKKSLHNILNIRGGFDTSLSLTGADYSGAAKALFGNIIGPASMLTGGLVPLGFLAEPIPADTKWKKKARCVYMALAVASLVSELVAIMYATVAVNKLTEVPVSAAESVFALIKRDYELSWMGANVHFMLGLFGFCGMVMLRALSIYPNTLNSSTAGLALSALIGMTSILNVGIAEGDGRGHKLGGNFFSLLIRYVGLVGKSVAEKRSITGAISVVMFIFFSTKIMGNLFQSESQN